MLLFTVTKETYHQSGQCQTHKQFIITTLNIIQSKLGSGRFELGSGDFDDLVGPFTYSYLSLSLSPSLSLQTFKNIKTILNWRDLQRQ